MSFASAPRLFALAALGCVLLPAAELEASYHCCPTKEVRFRLNAWYVLVKRIPDSGG